MKVTGAGADVAEFLPHFRHIALGAREGSFSAE